MLDSKESKKKPCVDYFKPESYINYFSEKVNVTLTGTSEKYVVYKKGDEGPVLLLLHGAGYSGLTWATFSKQISLYCKTQILAPDFRGHGETRTCDDHDLSRDRLCEDIIKLMGTLFETESMPPLVLVGHSMGGAIAVHLAESGAFSSLLAVVIIDAIEGTAMLALPAMKNILRSRPPGFSSLENAIKWSVISGQIRNLESARVSVPGQICLNSQIPHHQKISIVDTSEDIIKEEEEETSQTQSLVNFLYTWRADLARSEKFWPGWFHGITAKFLSTSAMKLLIVTGLDKLDTELTIAQMQGKFQVGIVPFAGHNVHEDAPEKVAEIIADFLKRFKICSRLNKSCRWPS